MGAWQVIVPVEATNKVLNPVAMGTGNYSAVGASTTITIANGDRATYLGCKSYWVESLVATDNAGIDFTLSALSEATTNVTVRVNNYYDSLPTAWDWSLDGTNFTVPTLIATEGDWDVYRVEFSSAQSNGSTSLKIYSKGSYTFSYYIGHVQVEQTTISGSAVYTTPITGDVSGFASGGYYWNGTAHAATSTREAFERSGGKVYDLEDDLNFRVLYPTGMGMPPIVHHVRGMSLAPGALMQDYQVMPRVIDLVSGTMANTSATVAAARKAFINYIKPDRVSPVQPAVLRYTGVNSNKPVDFHGYYDNGLEFQTTKGVIDKPAARFICYDPYAYEINTGSYWFSATVGSLSNADHAVRLYKGDWSNISTDFAAAVYAITRGGRNATTGKFGENTHELIYFGGAFTNVGDANGDYIVSYNPGTQALASLSTGTNGAVWALATDASGNVYLGGAFTDLGDANGDRISYWNGSAFTSLSTGIASGIVYALAFGLTGTLYIGGSFTNHGDANGDYISSWTGSAFASLGTGMNGNVRCIAVAPNGDVYAGGEFATAGGTTVNGIAKWNGTAWSALGTGVAGDGADVFAIAIDRAGAVYIGGDFTTADGVSCVSVAKWNGQTFEPLGAGLTGIVYTLYIDDDGLLHAGGNVPDAGGPPPYYMVWNGSTWVHGSIILPGSANPTAIMKDVSGLYIGYATAGTASCSVDFTIDNTSSATVYPKITINRAADGTTATLYLIKNETTGATLWFDYALNKGETLTLDFTPGNKSISSSMFGKIWRPILRGSDFATFCLQPGNNSISIFVHPVGSPTVTAWIEYPITHWSGDMVAA